MSLSVDLQGHHTCGMLSNGCCEGGDMSFVETSAALVLPRPAAMDCAKIDNEKPWPPLALSKLPTTVPASLIP